ncbi:MAG: hypothetical protein Q4D98_11175 [Planctomycetia bacterium]|nr:hypothetical protein [Planctomycetia bacterium]
MDNLKTLLSEAALQERTEPEFFDRGENYFRRGRVRIEEKDDEHILASVNGTHRYHVQLTVREQRLAGTCNCPVGRIGIFCKHLVATGLAYLSCPENVVGEKPAFDWKQFVRTLSQEELVTLVLEMSARCPQIIEKYRMKNLPSSPAAKVKVLQKKIHSLLSQAKKVTQLDGYDDYDYDTNESVSERFYEELTQLETILENLAKEKDFQTLYPVVEYGIEKSIATVEINPDEFLEIFKPLYVLSSSAEAPKRVVQKIQQWGSEVPFYELFQQFPKPILDLWYKEARCEWEKLPTLKMSDQSSSYEREFLESRLISFAEARGDIDFLLRIRQQNLSGPEHVLELLREYQRREMTEEILPLLQKAGNTFPDDQEIQQTLVRELRNRKKTKEALAQAWTFFENNPAEKSAFSLLMEIAEPTGKKTEFLDKALQHLEKLDVAKQSTYWNAFYIKERRVEILLDAGRLEQAWELRKGLNRLHPLGRRLAKMWGQDHPADAASLYRQWLDVAIQTTGEAAYEEVVSLLKEYEQYCRAAGNPAEFIAYFQWIQEKYRRRPRLMEKLQAYERTLPERG